MKIKILIATAALTAASLSYSVPTQASSNPFLGEVMLVGYTFCPRGWAELNGQILAINSNQALFSLLGTTYGGDGRTSFALPDMRGRAPVHAGQGPGLSERRLGSKFGDETTTMTTAQMPSHTHRAAIKTVNSTPNSPTPFTNAFTTLPVNAFVSGENPGEVGSTTKSPRLMNPNTMYVEPTGSGQAMNNMQPYLTVRYCIATVGIFPSRN